MAINETSPVGVPVPLCGATVMFTLTDWPCVMVVGLRLKVVVVGLNVTVFQLFTRFVALTEPKPEAKSYPTPLEYGAFGYPASPGTSLLPTVTSLKVQVLAGGVVVLEPLHCESFSVAASLYRT